MHDKRSASDDDIRDGVCGIFQIFFTRTPNIATHSKIRFHHGDENVLFNDSRFFVLFLCNILSA